MREIQLPEEPSLTVLQDHIKAICAQHGWDKNSVPEVFLLFSEECGELAKAIRLHTGFKHESSSASHEELAAEFADVLSYLMDLANRFDVNLANAYQKKQARNTHRKW